MLSATITGGLRLFIHFPIVEITQVFQLYRVISLPVPNAEGTVAARHTHLKEFLAISQDRQAFVELSERSVNSCAFGDGGVCPLSHPVIRKASRRACVIALFLRDADRMQRECDVEFSPWNGPEAVYLGARVWAYAAHNPQHFVLTCVEGGAKPQVRQEAAPAMGLFEVPKGCAAQTDEWKFQTSLQRTTQSPRGDNKPPAGVETIRLPWETELGRGTEAKKAPWHPILNDTIWHRATDDYSDTKTRRTLAVLGKTLVQLREEEEDRAREEAAPASLPPASLALGPITLVIAVVLFWFLLRRMQGRNSLADRELRQKIQAWERLLTEETATRTRMIDTLACDLRGLQTKMAAHEMAVGQVLEQHH